MSNDLAHAWAMQNEQQSSLLTSGAASAVSSPAYFMESEEESLRLDVKTNTEVVEEQGRWAGAVPGMRVLDLGCGAGKTTHILHRLVQPGGEVVGIDHSQPRIDFATNHYAETGIDYLLRDARGLLSDLGGFDLVWIRFLLEYYEQLSYGIAKNGHALLNPGGTLCLIDLDHNCLGHFGACERLERTMRSMVFAMQRQNGFDPFVGRKLYSFLYDLGCVDIEVRMSAHHLIYGELSETDRFNWLAKAEAVRDVPELFANDYTGGYEEFRRELVAYLEHPRRFIYTPLIMCKGRKTTP
jgi:2-polyprenyl-3-methyl-5-hydroxy-6-metoxy-1,4-benzoquinol methylase